MRAPETDWRLLGLLDGTAVGRWVSELREEMLARELGLLRFALGSRVGLPVGWEKPKESWLEGRLFSTDGDWRAIEALLPPVRRLELRMVTVAGMYDWPKAELARGEARGGVLVGAGSLDLAELTRSSSFCILPIRPRIWWREPEEGSVESWLMLSERERVVRRGITGLERPVCARMEGPREWRIVWVE